VPPAFARYGQGQPKLSVACPSHLREDFGRSNVVHLNIQQQHEPVNIILHVHSSFTNVTAPPNP